MISSRLAALSIVLLSSACASGGAKHASTAGTRAPATAQASGPLQVEGRVELLDRDHVTLAGTESAGHAFDKLTVDDRTQVTVDGRKATLADVSPGDPVRASFAPQGNTLHVDRLDVQPRQR